MLAAMFRSVKEFLFVVQEFTCDGLQVSGVTASLLYPFRGTFLPGGECGGEGAAEGAQDEGSGRGV